MTELSDSREEAKAYAFQAACAKAAETADLPEEIRVGLGKIMKALLIKKAKIAARARGQVIKLLQGKYRNRAPLDLYWDISNRKVSQ